MLAIITIIIILFQAGVVVSRGFRYDLNELIDEFYRNLEDVAIEIDEKGFTAINIVSLVLHFVYFLYFVYMYLQNFIVIEILMIVGFTIFLDAIIEQQFLQKLKIGKKFSIGENRIYSNIVTFNNIIQMAVLFLILMELI